MSKSSIDKNIKEAPFVPKEGQVDFSHIRWCPVVNCVVVYNRKALIVERNKAMRLYPEYWNGISGFLDDQKSLEEKVREELLQETGLKDYDISAIQLCGIFDQEARDIGKTWIVHAVRVEVTTDKLTFDWESQNHKWVTKAEALEHKLLPGFEEVLEAVLS